MASEQRLIGAVGIKVRPVTKGFREEIQQQLRNLPEGKVNVEVDADTRKAEKKIKDVSEDQKLNLRVGVTYDDLEKAKRQLQAELKRLGDVVIPVKLDEQGIKKALGKLDELGKKSSVVMKITEDKEGYEAVLAKIRAVQREKIVTNAVFEVDDDSLAKERLKYERLIAELAEPREIKLTYGNDRKSLQRALDTVNAELEKLEQVELNITADPAMLANTRDAIQEMLDAKPVVLKYGEDKAGYQAVLKKIQELRAEKLVKEIQFYTDDDSLAVAEAEIQEKLLELNKKAKIKLEVTSDYQKMLSSLGEVDKALQQLSKVEIEFELDKEGLEAKRREIEEALPDSTFDINVNTKDVAQLKKELDKIRGMLVEEASEGITLTVAPNEESLRHTKEKIEELIRSAERNPVKLKTEPVGLALAATQIGWAARSRVVPFYIRIDKKSRDVAEGVLKSLSGYNTLSNLGSSIENLITNFDTAALKGAQVAGVLGNVVNVLGYGVTNLLSIGDGVGKVIGLTAMAPAALSALAAMVLINVGAFTDFKDALDGSDEAMGRLPANAQAAVQALKGTWESIQQPIQNAYWEEMGTSLQDMVSTLLPKVRDGLAQSSTAVGRFAKNTADTFRELGTTDMFDKMFTNLSGMFENAAGAAEPLTRALNTLGLRGSEYLPQFGTWLTDITNRFNDWVQTADANDDINRWIEDGVDALQDMWSAGDGVVDVIRAITKASMAAGGTTLHELADEMQRWGRIASGEPFQSRLTAIFRGAREGASNLNKGFLDLAESIGESAGWVSNMLSLLGKLGGVTLTNLSRLFSNGTFKGGLYEAISGVTDMMDDLGPTFDSLGTVVGTLGTTAAAAFRGLAPLINTVSGALEDVAVALGDELPEVAEEMLGYMTGSFTSLAGLIVPVAEAVGTVLEVFNDLPDGIQRAIVALGAFTIMRGQISKMFSALDNTKPFQKLEEKWRQQQMMAGNAEAASEKFRITTASIALTKDGISNVGDALRRVGTESDTAKGFVTNLGTTLGGGITKGLGGLLAALGGPWGIALGAAAVGLSLYAQKQQEAKSRVEEHTAAIEAQNGVLGDGNVTSIVDRLIDDDGPGKAKSFNETLEALGTTAKDTAELIVQGGPAYDNLITQLDKGIAAGEKGADTWTQYGNKVAGNKEEWKAWTESMGIAENAVNHLNLSRLRDQLVSEREAVENSVDSWAARNATQQTNVGISDGLAASIKTLGDSANDATARIDAYRNALDSLNGTSRTAWERQRDLTASADELAGFLGEVDANGAKLNTGLVDLTTGFTTHTEAGGKLADMLDNLQTQQFGAAQQAYDMAGGVENAAAAAAAAETATKPYRDELQKLADAGLLSQAEVDALNKSLFGVPGSTPFELTDNESAAMAKLKVEELTKQIEATPDKEIEITEPLSDAVRTKLEELGYTITEMPEGTVKITEEGADETAEKLDDVANADRSADIKANPTGTFEASAAFNVVAEDRETSITGIPWVDAANAALNATALPRSSDISGIPWVDAANAALNNTALPRNSDITGVPWVESAANALNTTALPRNSNITGVPWVDNAAGALNRTALPRNANITGIPWIDNALNSLNRTALPRESWFNGRDDIEWTRARLDHMAQTRQAWFVAVADVGGAAAVLNSLSAPRTVYYRAIVEKVEAANGAILDGSGVQTFANGGITQPFKKYANGGIEDHTAKIYKPTFPFRIFAEPETGGEAYIPMSAAKRVRSTQILDEVAQQFGYQLTKGNTATFANGGVTGVSDRTGGGVAVNIGSYVTNQSDTPDDVARAIMRRVKTHGGYQPLEAF